MQDNEYYEPSMQGQYMPQMGGQSNRLLHITENENNFLKDIFNWSEHLDNLSHTWNGDEYTDKEWRINIDPNRRLMNLDGIKWCKNKLKSYTGSYYIATSFKDEEINNIIKTISKTINHELHKRWTEFGFRDKLDIKSVWEDMTWFIYAILKGSHGDAQRNFLGSTNQNTYVQTQDLSAKGGWFSSGSKKMFGGNNNG